MTKELVAVILAGGVGNRFWPFVTDKILFPWFSRPFIEYSVCAVLPPDVTRVVLVTNPQNNSHLSTIRFPVPSVTVVQRMPMGIADALLSASSELSDCALFIMNGDDVTNSDVFSQVVNKAKASNAFGVIPGYITPNYFPGGYIQTDGERITGIIEKPPEGKEPGNIIAMLGHYISDSNELIAELKKMKSDQDDVYEKTLDVLMKRHDFQLYTHTGDFASLKYPWHVLDVTDVLLKTLKSFRGKNVEIRSNVVIEGTVYIEDNVKIFENTKIVGPCYIGKGTIIGNNSIIRQSHIGANCVTGFNSDISRSYIGDDCWLHNNYIGDSVLEGNVSMGGGAACANLRLDDGPIKSDIKNIPVSTSKNKLGALIGKHTRIGVHTSIMPGVKIGKGTFVGSGVVLDKDLPEDSFCIVKSSYTISKNKTSVEGSHRDDFKLKI